MRITDKHINRLGELIGMEVSHEVDRQFLYDMLSSCLVITEISMRYHNQISDKFIGGENGPVPNEAAKNDGK